MVRFLLKADSYHGIWPHFLNGDTGRTIPFSRKDDGSRPRRDLLPHRRAALRPPVLRRRRTRPRARLRAAINWLWEEAEWSWHTQGGRNVLYWHWSPNNGWSMNHEIRGWNECLITYVLAASAPRYPIAPDVYHRGWADGRDFRNGRSLRRHHAAARAGRRRTAVPRPLLLPRPRPARPQRPLRRLLAAERRAHADQPRATACATRKGFKGYGPDCWGLTASDSIRGLRRAFADQRPRGDHADRGARLLPLHAGAVDAGAPALLPRARRPHLGRLRLRRRLQRDRRLVRAARTSRSTRARSS